MLSALLSDEEDEVCSFGLEAVRLELKLVEEVEALATFSEAWPTRVQQSILERSGLLFLCGPLEFF